MKDTSIKEKNDKNTDFILDMQGVETINKFRNDYIILIEKETGTWTTLNKSKSYIIEEILEKGMTFNKFKELYPQNVGLLQYLFEKGILRINNQSIKNDKITEKRCKISQSKICHIVLRYTKKCNLSCTYCYAHLNVDKKPTMSNDTALYILNKMLNTYQDKTFSLSFHGGEPLLRYKDMVPLVKKIRMLSKNIKLCIQTNGTLVTREIAQFLKDEDFEVGISLDGYNQKTNFHRCQTNGNSSFEKSLIGLDHLLSVGIIPGLIAVVTGINQYQLLEIFDFYIAKGIKKINFTPIVPSGKASNSDYEIDIDNLVSTHIELLKKINKINNQYTETNDYVYESNLTNIMNSLASFNVSNLCTLSPCGAGRTTVGFDTDGSIYPCDNFVGYSDFNIGNIYEIEDIKKTMYRGITTQGLLNRDINNIPECFICPWKEICVLRCPSDPYFYSKTFNKTHSMCVFEKKIIPEIIDLLYKKQIDLKNIIHVK